MYKICHTEESSRRQRQLERGLLEALKSQPYEKVTLSELCLQLQIPRKSFYRYFPTKEDCLLALIDHTLSDCNSLAMTHWDGGKEMRKMDLQQFFTYWQEQAVFLDVVRDNELRFMLLDRTTVIVDAMKAQEPETSFARDQVEYFIAHGLMATVLRWHHFGFQSSAEEMAETFSQLLHSRQVSITRLLL